MASHTLEAAKYREILIAKIVANAEPLAEALLAKGLSGDVPALKEINERALGKTPQPLTGANGGPIQIEGVEITVRR